ncbi:MAG: iron hydrogenase small subunit [Comamonadaceae bacterium]|nr:iron hydrogenase small subunit [Comamonadaceae bacterium]
MQKFRQSHENPSVKKIYEIFLEKPLGHKSHELLHTHYIKSGNEHAPQESRKRSKRLRNITQ